MASPLVFFGEGFNLRAEPGAALRSRGLEPGGLWLYALLLLRLQLRPTGVVPAEALRGEGQLSYDALCPSLHRLHTARACRRGTLLGPSGRQLPGEVEGALRQTAEGRRALGP